MADKDIILKQFSSKQARIDKRRAEFDQLKKQLESGKKAKITKAQKALKAAGRYGAAKIDGIHGKATTKALAAIRAEIRADQSRLDKRLEAHQNRVAKAGADKLAGKKLEAGENARKDKNAYLQTGYQAGALGISIGVTKYQVSRLNALDKPAITARNKELARYAKEIETLKSDKTSLTKAKNLKAPVKTRIGAIAKSAKLSGVTTYKGPIGAYSSGALLLKAGLLKYAATQTENAVLKGSLDATGNAMILAGAATPAARITQNAFGVNRLHGKHLAKLADAEALAATVKPKKAKAPVKVSFAGKITRGVGKVLAPLGKALAPIGYGIAAYAAIDTAHRVFSDGGGSAKAATKGIEAGADVLTMGQSKKWRANPQNSFESMINRRAAKIGKRNKPPVKSAAKVRSVQGALRQAKDAAKPIVRNKKSPAAIVSSSKIKVKAHTRKINGRSVRVGATYRKVR